VIAPAADEHARVRYAQGNWIGLETTATAWLAISFVFWCLTHGATQDQSHGQHGASRSGPESLSVSPMSRGLHRNMVKTPFPVW